ncbi:Protein MAIN-LIKE 2 [Linum grandiflorum]
MERWRPETNTFHMYHGEVSITLQDVAHLTGLSVSGDALYVEYEKETNWAAIVQEVLGKSPVGHMKDGGRVLMRWLHDNRLPNTLCNFRHDSSTFTAFDRIPSTFDR